MQIPPLKSWKCKLSYSRLPYPISNAFSTKLMAKTANRMPIKAIDFFMEIPSKAFCHFSQSPLLMPAPSPNAIYKSFWYTISVLSAFKFSIVRSISRSKCLRKIVCNFGMPSSIRQNFSMLKNLPAAPQSLYPSAACLSINLRRAVIS